MKKIIISLAVIGVVSAIVIGGTVAYFSDTEVSLDNILTAGAIDLKISNESYVSNKTTGELEASANTSWLSKDLTEIEKFFNFTDLKPGDIGEDTIDIIVDNNDAWVCATIVLTSNSDNTCTEPELEIGADPGCLEGQLMNGDLADSIEFVWWADDGDNVLEIGEVDSARYLGPESISSLLGEDNVLDITIADSQFNFFNGATNTPLAGAQTYYIGKGWCFGEMTLNPEPNEDGTPLTRGTGFDCDGSTVGNESQTDRLTANISFTAVQTRNNVAYLCPEHQGSIVETRNISLENKTEGTWQIISDDQTYGDIQYSHNDISFHGVVTGTGLTPNGKYQITLNGPVEASGTCGFTNLSLGNFASNGFEGGFWNSAAPNLSSTCTGGDEEGLYNMNLIGDHYTFIADESGAFNYPFDFALPAGDYSGVKVLVKKMLDTHVSPWADTGTGYPAFNLYETAAISFTIL